MEIWPHKLKNANVLELRTTAFKQLEMAIFNRLYKLSFLFNPILFSVTCVRVAPTHHNTLPLTQCNVGYGVFFWHTLVDLRH